MQQEQSDPVRRGLTASELCEKYAASGVSIRTWRYWLEKWRRDGKLVRYAHWYHERQVNDHGSTVAVRYSERRVLMLIASEDRSQMRYGGHSPFAQAVLMAQRAAIMETLTEMARGK